MISGNSRVLIRGGGADDRGASLKGLTLYPCFWVCHCAPNNINFLMKSLPFNMQHNGQQVTLSYIHVAKIFLPLWMITITALYSATIKYSYCNSCLLHYVGGKYHYGRIIFGCVVVSRYMYCNILYTHQQVQV